MAGAIFYVLTFVAAVAALTVWPKTEKKMNLVVSIMFSYVTVLCIGALGAVIINALRIPVDLWRMGSLYVLICFVGIFTCLLKRQMQKLFIRKWDVLAVSFVFLAVGIISLHIFTPYIHWNYENTVDPSVHYMWAMEVVRNKHLSGMFFAALYNGMFIGLFQWCLPMEWTYKAFILADIFHTIMEFLFFYAVAVVLMKSAKKQWAPIAVSFLYWCGYPLFSFALGGYVYWGMAVMLIEYVIFLLKWYEEGEEHKKTLLCLVMLGCFAVSVCYIEFAPGIFITVFGTVIYHMIMDKKLRFSKRSLSFLFIGVFITGVCAIIGYKMIFANENLKIFDALKIGSMSTNALELLVVCPVIVIIMMETWKRKERWNVFHIGIFVYMGIQLVMTLMSSVGMISTYYLFKEYIVLWFLVFAVLIRQAGYLGNREKRWFRNYILGILCFLIFSYDGDSSGAVSFKHSIFRENINLFVNKDFSDGLMSDNGKLYLFQYAMEHLVDENTVVPLIVTNEKKGAGSFYCALYEKGVYVTKGEWTEEELESFLQESNLQYFIIFFDDPLYRKLLHDYLDTFDRVFQNENGFIAKR